MAFQLTPNVLRKCLAQPPICCLFLDIDGTLAPFELNPADSKIPDDTLSIIKKLQYIGVGIAIITGRSLLEARRMLAPLEVPIGATHGLEIAFNSNQTPLLAAFIPHELPLIIVQINQSIDHLSQQGDKPDFFLEIKPYSAALHYRQSPHLATVAETLIQSVAKNFPNWQLKPGKFVWEIMPNGVDKGMAVTAILAHFNQSLTSEIFPLFIGDDVSDEAGFLAVQAAGGMGIKVGESVTTNADFFVENIEQVRQVLQSILDFYQPNF